MAETKEKKARKPAVRRPTVCDDSEVQCIARIGRELASVGPETAANVVQYFHGKFFSNGDTQE